MEKNQITEKILIFFIHPFHFLNHLLLKRTRSMIRGEILFLLD